MARGVTQDQVTRAADALLARGERPTIEKVRTELGTGSPNTLLRLLEVWWAELAGRLAAQARAQLPGIPDAVQRAMMTLWSEAVVATRQEAEIRYKELEQELGARETALQTQLDQIAAKEEAQQQSFTRVSQELEVVRGDLVNERRRAEDLQQSLSAAIRSLSEAQSTAEALRRSGEAAQKALEIDRTRAEATERRWLQEVDRAREESKSATRNVQDLRKDLAQEQQKGARLLEQLETQRKKTQQHLATLEKELKAALASKSSRIASPSSTGSKKPRRVAKSGPGYPRDDGPLTGVQLRQIRRKAAPVAKQSVRSSLLETKK